jgi:dynein intermediate chain 1
VALFSLKNPSHPEYSFATSSGVQCLHFHPDFPNLLAVGLYDGNVLVLDVRYQGAAEPMYRSSTATKHVEPVTQVGCWQWALLGGCLWCLPASVPPAALLQRRGA